MKQTVTKTSQAPHPPPAGGTRPWEDPATRDYRFGNIEVRVPERALLVDGRPAALGARAFDVLRYLVEHQGRVVTKDELLEFAWPRLVVEENNLQVQVSTLRKVLGQHAIATIAGYGYKFSLEETGAGPLSIVVLPFANQTGDPHKGYVADALTTSITSDLLRIRDAFVIPPATAFTYRERPAPVQQVGMELGVHFVLQGSVLSSGERIRITAQLADTHSGAQLWSDTFDGELVDLFALQDMVTTRIVNSIDREMVVVAARESETRKNSPKVADLMLRARALNLKPQSLGNHQQLEAWYRQVLALDPKNVGAMVGLAWSLVLQPDNFGSGMDVRVKEHKYAEGRDLALRAKDLDPAHPGVHLAMYVYAANHDDFGGYRQSAEAWPLLEPKNPRAINGLALSYLRGGEPAKTIELLTKAINLDPRQPADVILLNMGCAHLLLEDEDAAIVWLLRALQTNPGLPVAHAYLALAYALKQNDAKARETVHDLHRIDPGFRFTSFGKPYSSNPAAYRNYWDRKLLPGARMAGLPE
jgi:TolB-like protein/tetratricopeptide (TPR) repeat protein